MKINEWLSQQLIQNDSATRNKQADPTGTDEFGRMLDEQIAADAGTTAPVSDPATEAVEAMGTPFWLPDTVDATGTSAAVSGVESVLNNLDRFQELLELNASNTEGMQDAISALKESAGQLLEELGGLPEEHPLRQIGDELSVLAYVEEQKWNRGDYS